MQHQVSISYSARRSKWRVTLYRRGTWLDGGYYVDRHDAEKALAYLKHRLFGLPAPADYDPLSLPPTARRFLIGHGVAYQVRA